MTGLRRYDKYKDSGVEWLGTCRSIGVLGVSNF